MFCFSELYLFVCILDYYASTNHQMHKPKCKLILMQLYSLSQSECRNLNNPITVFRAFIQYKTDSLVLPSLYYYFIYRYWQVKKKCPRCEYQWSDDIGSTMFNLRKVISKFKYLFTDLLNIYSHFHKIEIYISMIFIFNVFSKYLLNDHRMKSPHFKGNVKCEEMIFPFPRGHIIPPHLGRRNFPIEIMK